ncbi:MAG: efflux RND transporter permease subunit [Verrucomicrobia bacterium]|nr:efflux RND transporter permease subunit [Verrucomicrobiota bacterium]
MDVAYREVSDRVERARTRFPDGVEKPYIYKYTLKSRSAFKTMDAIRNIPIRRDLFLKDVATLTFEPEEAESLYRYNSQPANGISVMKEGEANTVEVCRRVIEVIEKIKQDPALAGFDLSVYSDQGEEIVKRLDALIDNRKSGALLAAAVLFFFLRQFRMTMIISLAIPLCLLIALTVMFFAAKTLNSLTIMGLVICVGLLVRQADRVLLRFARPRLTFTWVLAVSKLIFPAVT